MNIRIAKSGVLPVRLRSKSVVLRRRKMEQIKDAPGIRAAETKGYPVGEDTVDIEIKIFPTMPEWLWGEE